MAGTNNSTNDTSYHERSIVSPAPILSDSASSVQVDNVPLPSFHDGSSHMSFNDNNQSNTTVLTDTSTSVHADSNQPNSSFSPVSSPQLRRTGRVRVPPDRYGDWITNQQTAIDPDARIWFV